MVNYWTLAKAFANFGAIATNHVWSWSARSSDEKTIVLTLWEDRLTYDGGLLIYDVRDDPNKEQWVNARGNKDRIKNLVLAFNNPNVQVRAVRVKAKNVHVVPRSISERWPDQNLFLRITHLNPETGEFRAEEVKELDRSQSDNSILQSKISAVPDFPSADTEVNRIAELTKLGLPSCERKNHSNGGFMSKLTIPAARVKQGDLVLYATSIKVKDLTNENFYSVETLDPENTNDTGYQRLLNEARAKKLADYIVKGQDRQDAFLPTSVLLATHNSIDFNEQNNTIVIDTDAIGSFSVVDGQHRLEGLKMAAQKDPRVLDFDVPVNIAINLPRIAQMCHFLIVNTTQKSVDQSVAQRIIARLTEALNIEDLPSLPKWILNIVERGEVDKAVKLVIYLNEVPESPWKGKILMANEGSEGTTINQRSFVKAIVKYLLTANNPLFIIFNDFEKEKRVFLNYWKSVSDLLDDGNAAVLYKYNGVELFCKFSIPFFSKLQEQGKFTVPVMKELLSSCFKNVEGEYAGVGHPEWWAKGGNASFLNAGAINVVSQEMSKALHRVSMTTEIEI